MGGEDFEAGSDGDMDDMGDAGYNEPGSELPEGVKKEVVKEGDGWKKPKKGDEVTVHYVGTLESDGSEFDSSRARGTPFVFTLGKGQVIKGWDLGVAAMKKGEVAKFTLAPEFAYGDAGSLPKIPEKATLVFEIELISWSSKDDLFGDEGVIKTQLTEGSGWKTPKDGDEVLLSLKAEAADGSIIEERKSVEYTMGSGALGPITKVCEKALGGMKKGEEASLKCAKDYAYGDQRPDGAIITLTLHELFVTKDLSAKKDNSLMKKQVKEGEGYDTPKDAWKVKLSVEAAVDASGSPLPGFSAKVLEFTVGNGEVCDALEFATIDMKKGERAFLTVTGNCSSTVAEAQLGLKDLKADEVKLTLEMQDWEKAKDTWSLSEEEKIEFGTARKDIGATLFKSGRFVMALERYKKVADLFNYIENFKEENKKPAKQLKSACELNKAACFLKLQEHSDAKTACNAVLKEDSQNVKAIFRRAQAEFGLKNFPECMKDCKRVVELDAQNREARALLKQAQAGQKEVDKQVKGLFANMCKALGKGPIPEPGKVKPPFDEEDDEDMPEEAPEVVADGGENSTAKAEASAEDGEAQASAAA